MFCNFYPIRIRFYCRIQWITVIFGQSILWLSILSPASVISQIILRYLSPREVTNYDHNFWWPELGSLNLLLLLDSSSWFAQLYIYSRNCVKHVLFISLFIYSFYISCIVIPMYILIYISLQILWVIRSVFNYSGSVSFSSLSECNYSTPHNCKILLTVSQGISPTLIHYA